MKYIKNVRVLFLLLALSIGLGLYLWKPLKNVETHLKKSSFAHLPGWEKADPIQSLHAFQTSCKPFLRLNPDKSVGSKHIALTVNDWRPACQAALALQNPSRKKARDFFEQWFMPVEFYQNQPVEGLFTGYYMPLLKGSLTKTEKYSTPIYGLPDDLIRVPLGMFDSELKHHRNLVGRIAGKTLIPYYTREEISNGAIDKHAPIIAWTDSKVERQFLEIEGSGVIQLADGQKIYVGYVGENGAPYTPIANVLIKKGVMTKHNASMQRIRNYFKMHPDAVESVLNQNKSFVFFSKSSQKAAIGAQGVALTPGYSLAVDRKWVPLGMPIWLNTTRPDNDGKGQKPFQRLMIAQDTGGAIRGPVRGDVYWGDGERAIAIAGHMKNQGFYWLLLPKHVASRLLVSNVK